MGVGRNSALHINRRMLIPLLFQKSLLSLSLATSIFFNNNDCYSLDTTFPPSSNVIATSSSATTTAAVLPIPLFRRYDTANDIPSSYYKDKKVIRGRVIKVIDGDTIRVRHTPLYPFDDGRDCKKAISQCTISVRLYAVDAPETAKRGNPGQAFADEATQYTSKQVLDKVVRVKLLRKDQYSRVVGKVTARNNLLPFLKQDLSVSLAEKGLASLYTGGGKEYDGNKDVLQKKIEKAKKKKIGIWSGKDGDYVDPAQFKREMKARNGK